MILNFKEIPEAHKGGGNQDSFELFCREFLEQVLGLKIIQEPGRGADGGRDIIASEIRTGLVGSNEFRWLVSCKHKAHSGLAVGEQEEQNISDRVLAAKCDGFMSFYSTLPSAALITRLKELNFEHAVYDREKIERVLLTKTGGVELAKRFFPKSVEQYLLENPAPADLFAEQGVLECPVCRKNVFKEPAKSLVCIWEDKAGNAKRIYACCKGTCDRTLSAAYKEEGTVDAWFDLTELMVPTLFLKKIMAFMNRVHDGMKVEKEAFESLKEILINAFPFVARHLTKAEKEKVSLAIMYDDMGF